jgi:hypothetical protein|tara:strand:- start:642 stop:1019 length:378 start_codon:yes stop_codon:yes gene_type:complete
MRWHTLWSFILLLLFSSATYLTYLVSRAGGLDPMMINNLMQNDLATLGPAAFLLDIVVFGLIIRWVIVSRQKKSKNVEKPAVFVPPMIQLPAPEAIPPFPELPTYQSDSTTIWNEMAMLNEYENL